jgi:iron complex outermembrane receptor protein
LFSEEKQLYMRTFILCFLLSSGYAFGQTHESERLQEILLRGNFAKTVNPGYSIQVIGDSILRSDYQSLGMLLQEQANLYFKQNGYGMVSSISLRGTTASQTGVFWNGILINSSLTGQTDFNTLQGNSFSEIEIRRGGGSVLLGSGAVGGAVNLSDRIAFGAEDVYHLFLGSGSYNTFKGQFTGRMSSERFFAKISLGGYASDNDYPYLGTTLKNDNGEIENYNASLSFGYKLGERNQFNLYTTLFSNDRNLPRTLTATSRERLENLDSRLMAEWKYLGDRYTSSLKVAYLHEDYTYFFNRDNPENRAEGESDRWVGRFDMTYYLNEAMLLKGGLEFENARGNGYNLSEAQRDDFTAYALFQHRLSPRFVYDLSTRAGASSAYAIPVIFSADASLALTDDLDLRGAYSSNYRLPSFNDLYWVPGGNPDLEPESSHSAELGLNYEKSGLRFSVTGFAINSRDLIQWQPVSGGIWSPTNINRSSNYGIEAMLRGSFALIQNGLSWNLQYDYTRATDEDLDTRLIYVPEHRANAILTYLFSTWAVQYQVQYTGEVFTTTSNSQVLDDYAISNIEVSKSFLKESLRVLLQVNNLFDKAYESVAYRPMPNRNFQLNINFKF